MRSSLLFHLGLPSSKPSFTETAETDLLVILPQIGLCSSACYACVLAGDPEANPQGAELRGSRGCEAPRRWMGRGWGRAGGLAAVLAAGGCASENRCEEKACPV